MATDNTTYFWETTAGYPSRMLDPIEDSVGIDTIDLSNQDTRCVVRLEDGATSRITDQFRFSIADGTIIENAIGGSANDFLIGNNAANRLVGNAGGDRIDGGGGRDVLVGGRGRDVFVYDDTSDSGPSAATRDVITDLVRGMDIIDLSGIDANAATDVDDAFVCIGTAAFSGTDATGQLRFEDGVIYASTDADADAEFSIAVTGVNAVTPWDFVL